MSSEEVKPFVLDTAHKNEIIRDALMDYSAQYAFPDESLDADTYSLQYALYIRSEINKPVSEKFWHLSEEERQNQIKIQYKNIIDTFNAIDTDKIIKTKDAYIVGNTVFSRGLSYYNKSDKLIDGFDKEKLKFFANKTASYLFSDNPPQNLISRREHFCNFFWYANFYTDGTGRTYAPNSEDNLKYNLYDYLDESMHLTVSGSKAAEFFEMYYRRLASNIPEPIEFKKIYVKRPELLRIIFLQKKLTVQHLLLLTNVAKEKDKSLIISLLEGKQSD